MISVAMPNPLRFHAEYESARFYIGQLAAMTGASRKAIRHYEAIGLLPKPVRQGSYRVYGGKDVFLVHVIRHAQSYGFTLAEVRALVTAIAHEKKFPLKTALAAVRQKQQTVRREAAALRQLDRKLSSLRNDIKKHFS